MSTQTVNPFFSWTPPGKSLVVQIDYTVVERMNVEVMRGFAVTRRRGTEMGGVLIGHIDRRRTPVVHIQDFELVPCEYASGPSYVLSDTDRQRFRDMVAKWRPSLDRDWYAVGYFRSHTRDGFCLDEKDADLFHEFFPDPLDVALLIKPFATRAANAGFFLKNGGALETASTPLEFNFEAPTKTTEAAAESATPPVRAGKPAEPHTHNAPVRVQPVPTDVFAPARDVLVHPEPVRADPPKTTWLRRISWTLFCFALIALGIAGGYEYANWQTAPAAASSSGTPRAGLPNADLYNIQLQVLPGSGVVTLKWNRDAAPIQAALHGVLTVSEGHNSREVKLGFAELRNGIVMYPHVAPSIRFRLELFFADNRAFAETAEFREPLPQR